jgi:hypothetical protein
LHQCAQQRVSALWEPKLAGEPFGGASADGVRKQPHKMREPARAPREGGR